MDAFVHASGDGFGNTAPLRSDTGAIDMDAISQVAHVTQGAGKLTRKEKKHAKREMKRRKKEAKKAEKEAKKTYSSIKSQLKDRDKELSDKMADARKKRDSAKDVVNYIGYNKMYQDGIYYSCLSTANRPVSTSLLCRWCFSIHEAPMVSSASSALPSCLPNTTFRNPLRNGIRIDKKTCGICHRVIKNIGLDASYLDLISLIARVQKFLPLILVIVAQQAEM